MGSVIRPIFTTAPASLLGWSILHTSPAEKEISVGSPPSLLAQPPLDFQQQRSLAELWSLRSSSFSSCQCWVQRMSLCSSLPETNNIRLIWTWPNFLQNKPQRSYFFNFSSFSFLDSWLPQLFFLPLILFTSSVKTSQFKYSIPSPSNSLFKFHVRRHGLNFVSENRVTVPDIVQHRS